MFTSELMTDDENVRLVRPDVERDAALSLTWLAGATGRDTLQKMGNTEAGINSPTLQTEWARIQEFLDKEDQLNWMIEQDGRIVGSIWVDLEPSEYLQAPAIHIMIGDQAARGQGSGGQALRTVANWLEQERGESKIYTRRLVDNKAADALLNSAGFSNNGDTYRGKDNLLWQNMIKVNN